MNKNALGVIIARFQVPELHEGHRSLIDTALANHEQVLVILGTSDTLATERNPLAYDVRRAMILDDYPTLLVDQVFDVKSDEIWSERIDSCIATYAPEAVLYGSRDSFTSSYSGSHPTVLLPEFPAPRGEDVREGIGEADFHSADFRRGLIYAQVHRLPMAYPAVDIVVVDHAAQAVLMGQKDGETTGWRFVGGFVDTTDPSFEAAALRELAEETGKDTLYYVEDVRCIGSLRTEDWRYRDSKDFVFTTVFTVRYGKSQSHELPQAGDDLARLAWIPLSELRDKVLPGHRPIADTFLAWLATSEWAGMEYVPISIGGLSNANHS